MHLEITAVVTVIRDISICIAGPGRNIQVGPIAGKKMKTFEGLHKRKLLVEMGKNKG